MKKFTLLFLGNIIAFSSFSQAVKSTLSIIPEPVSVVTNPGTFILPKHVIIQAGNSAGLVLVTTYLKNKLTASTGALVTIKSTSATPPSIKLMLTSKADTTLGKEGYHLTVGKKSIVIKANDPAGLFYGVQTLLQLFPKEIESTETVSKMAFTAPCVGITDYPRFGWRGLMLDVSRHFLH